MSLDAELQRYIRAMAAQGLGTTPREVAASLLRSDATRYWLVCGVSYLSPGALWRGSSWWPKESAPGLACLPFPVTGWTHVSDGHARSVLGEARHLIAYRVVGIEEAEVLKAPFVARGWTLRLWDVSAGKQVTTYGHATLDLVEEGWRPLEDRPWPGSGLTVTGWTSPDPLPMPPLRPEFTQEYARRTLRALDIPGVVRDAFREAGIVVDPPLTVRVGSPPFGHVLTEARIEPKEQCGQCKEWLARDAFRNDGMCFRCARANGEDA